MRNISEVISRLKTDHRRMRNVLGALQKKLNQLSTTISERDSDHLFCLISYMSVYPDKVHHPLEDRLFNLLAHAQLDTEQAANIESLSYQHTQLLTLTEQFLSNLDELDSDFELESFRNDLTNYINLQMEHMTFEENKIFPMALALFAQGSLLELDPTISKSEDPLFEKLEQSYAAIYQFLDVDNEEKAQGKLALPLYRYLGATASWK